MPARLPLITTSTLMFERRFRRDGLQRDRRIAALTLSFAKKLKERVDVFAERFDELLSRRAGLFNNRVRPMTTPP